MGRLSRRSWRLRLFWIKYLTLNGGLMPDLSTGHPALPDPRGPHEPAAVLRMQRAGWRGPQIQAILKMSPQRVMAAMQKALDEEGQAHRDGREIHDAVINRHRDGDGQWRGGVAPHGKA